MQSEQTLTQLTQSINMTLAMQQLAEQEKWDELAALELQRQQILADIFPLETVSETQAEQIQPLLEKLISMNHSLEQLCADARDKFRVELASLSKHKKAASAYLSR